MKNVKHIIEELEFQEVVIGSTIFETATLHYDNTTFRLYKDEDGKVFVNGEDFVEYANKFNS